MVGAEERIRLAGLMLDDTLATLKAVGSPLLVVSGDMRAKEIAESHGARFIREEKDSGVNSAVALANRYCVGEGDADASVVVPQDLPLLNVKDINTVIGAAKKEKKGIVVCPSLRYDGTNVLLRRPADVIRTHYDNNSYEMHLKSASDAGVNAQVMKLERLMFDIDTPEDVTQIARMENVTAKATASFLKSCRAS